MSRVLTRIKKDVKTKSLRLERALISPSVRRGGLHFPFCLTNVTTGKLLRSFVFRLRGRQICVKKRNERRFSSLCHWYCVTASVALTSQVEWLLFCSVLQPFKVQTGQTTRSTQALKSEKRAKHHVVCQIHCYAIFTFHH